jgi:hypothetical protein
LCIKKFSQLGIILPSTTWNTLVETDTFQWRSLSADLIQESKISATVFANFICKAP